MTRPIIFLIAVLTLAALWLVPWVSLGVAPFSAHMIVHMGIVAVAAPLLALGVAGTAFDPVARLPALFPPIPVSLLEFVVVWVWHTPALHHAARHLGLAFFAEQGMFFLSGLWLWLAVFGGSGDERRSRAASGVIALLLTAMHMTLLGALLALAPRPLFAHGAADAAAALNGPDIHSRARRPASGRCHHAVGRRRILSRRRAVADGRIVAQGGLPAEGKGMKTVAVVRRARACAFGHDRVSRCRLRDHADQSELGPLGDYRLAATVFQTALRERAYSRRESAAA